MMRNKGFACLLVSFAAFLLSACGSSPTASTASRSGVQSVVSPSSVVTPTPELTPRPTPTPTPELTPRPTPTPTPAPPNQINHAPEISNLDAVQAYGSTGSYVYFTLKDADGDRINWTATIYAPPSCHCTAGSFNDPDHGTVASGTNVDIRYQIGGPGPGPGSNVVVTITASDGKKSTSRSVEVANW